MRKGRVWLLGGSIVGGLLAGGLVARSARRRQVYQAQRARNARARVLVVGAGVVGSTYAEHLARWGMQVSLLARGARVQELMNEGLWVCDALRNVWRSARVRVVTDVSPEDAYDLVLVAVRCTQAASALELLRPLAPTVPLLVLQNNPDGAAPLAQALGQAPLLGFPATGGVRRSGRIRSLPLWLRPTIIGEPDGAITQRLRQATAILQSAGLHVEIQRKIVPWLQTHAAMIAVLAGCAYKAGGHLRQMAADKESARYYLAALREAYGILRANAIPITPPVDLSIFRRPVWLQLAVVRAAGWAPWTSLLVDGHLAAAPEEMLALHAALMALARRAAAEAPLLAALGEYFPKSTT